MEGNAPPVLRRLQLFDGNVQTLIGKGRATFTVYCFSRIVAYATSAGSCTVSSNIAFSNAAPRHVTLLGGETSARSSLLTDCDRPLDREHKKARIRYVRSQANGSWVPCAHDRQDHHNLSARRIGRLISRSVMSVCLSVRSVGSEVRIIFGHCIKSGMHFPAYFAILSSLPTPYFSTSRYSSAS
jgi:hypothetical protein